MGFFTGSVDRYQNPGSEMISNQLLDYQSNFGKAGQYSNRILRDAKNGMIGERPEFAAIRNFGATRKQEAGVEGASGANALFAGNQPVLSRRLTDLAKSRVDQDTGLQVSAAVPGVISAALGGSQAALDAKRNAEIMKIIGAGNILNGGSQLIQKQGIGGPLIGGLLGAAGGLFTGAGAAGGISGLFK